MVILMILRTPSQSSGNLFGIKTTAGKKTKENGSYNLLSLKNDVK